jgi:hypothetical protein
LQAGYLFNPYQEETMKRKILLVVGLPMLFAAQAAFACDSDHTAEMHSIIAQKSSAENVKAAYLQKKARHCEQNAINLRLQGDKQVSYVTSCMNENQALDLKTKRQGI